MPCLDSLSRPINYLRISVTDRCNLRCVYCMPAEGVPEKFTHDAILSYEEIVRVVQAAADLGISKIRLTGGEPLVRLGVVDLVEMIVGIPGIDDISMTTNATLLARYAGDLKRAGLHRVNVSLDTLRPERFQQITRLGKLENVLAGIDAAARAGLQPIKINCVVMRGVNDDEIVDFARLTLTQSWHVRFIEVMRWERRPAWRKWSTCRFPRFGSASRGAWDLCRRPTRATEPMGRRSTIGWSRLPARLGSFPLSASTSASTATACA